MKAVVAAFNQEKAPVGAFSVITNLRMELFEALKSTAWSYNEQNSVSPRGRAETGAATVTLEVDKHKTLYIV